MRLNNEIKSLESKRKQQSLLSDELDRLTVQIPLEPSEALGSARGVTGGGLVFPGIYPGVIPT